MQEITEIARCYFLGTTYKGIDVSKYQGVIDWNKVAADGVQFAFIRVGWAGYEGASTRALTLTLTLI